MYNIVITYLMLLKNNHSSEIEVLLIFISKDIVNTWFNYLVTIRILIFYINIYFYFCTYFSMIRVTPGLPGRKYIIFTYFESNHTRYRSCCKVSNTGNTGNVISKY